MVRMRRPDACGNERGTITPFASTTSTMLRNHSIDRASLRRSSSSPICSARPATVSGSVSTTPTGICFARKLNSGWIDRHVFGDDAIGMRAQHLHRDFGAVDQRRLVHDGERRGRVRRRLERGKHVLERKPGVLLDDVTDLVHRYRAATVEQAAHRVREGFAGEARRATPGSGRASPTSRRGPRSCGGIDGLSGRDRSVPFAARTTRIGIVAKFRPNS